MKKYVYAGLSLVLAGCGAITPQSIYEGLRTQQSVKNAGTANPEASRMGTYDAYEKEREKLKPQNK
jgi:hypothetical protein